MENESIEYLLSILNEIFDHNKSDHFFEIFYDFNLEVDHSITCFDFSQFLSENSIQMDSIMYMIIIKRLNSIFKKFSEKNSSRLSIDILMEHYKEMFRDERDESFFEGNSFYL